MSYKSFKGKWQVAGDKPTVTILPAGLFCFNKPCYEQFIKVTNCKYAKLYYDPEFKKIAFELLPEKKGEQVFPISLTKTGLVAVVNGKVFFNHHVIKYPGEVRSYPARQTYITEPGPGYKRTWSETKKQVIEIRLDEYITL